ncbi:reverse transcriptase [Gossypium australe]|uniref:Reverse transcriptase n=1 Tax=Gossypium australe TaxID=47621 RepID=A0A5B6UZK7_9ROSI|nr:reverse transcriptase [Gossypium australe]
MNGIEIEADGSRGGLCLAWKEDISVTLKSFSKSHIDVLALLRRLGEEANLPWLVMGDFNEILYSFEKEEGLPKDERRMEIFCKTLEDCQLEDIGYSGAWFTWERGKFVENNVRERLDRGVANEKWKPLFPKCSILHLSQSLSDHCPLFLNTTDDKFIARSSQFKFEARWIMESSLEGVIKASWNSNTGTILEKLERLQDKLKEWAASIRKTREGRKRKLTKELEMLETKERDDDTIAKIIETRVNLNMEIDKDEMYWEQRERANWLKVGDKNLAFFYKFASTRRKQNTISRLQLEDGGESSDDSQMAEAATSYFQELFMSNGIGDLSHIMQDEVLAALKGMGPIKAPGPDGFPALFFQRFWHIVGNDVTKFCLGFLNDNQELGQINFTDIILIPKTQSPTSLANFRPISLCSVLYKTVAKIAFVPRRLISDNILLAYEILHTFRQKRTGKKGYMAVKLDMSKAYDRVEWRFIEEVMLRMGFENSEGLSALMRLARKEVFYSSNTSEESKRQVLAILGVRSSADMEKYVGLPNTVGRRKKESFQNLKDNIQARIKGWSSRFLSQGGKEVFIKSVLQAIPTYAISCFLFPNSLCGELEGTMAKFWWQKAHGKRGIHWCQWKYLCLPKDEGGLGFRSLAKFNVALLAKQGWRILMMPNSLVAKVLKAKYFPNTDFLNSRLGNNCSFTWKSIWAAKGVLSDGLCWKVGCGSDISVLNDSWIPDFNKVRLLPCVNNLHDFRVAELIDENSRKWKEELIRSTFSPGVANKILRIPLTEEAHDNILAWSGAPSSEFTVRSAYKLLQCNEADPRAYALQTDYKKFYKKL